MSLFENFVYKNGEIVDNSWIEWNHESVPNKPKEIRDLINDNSARQKFIS